ncbi:MAG: hypothetical protein K6D96_07695 [Acetatifactor sp.]|nr:hypothetical protein [Acetatifactor sp.]
MAKLAGNEKLIVGLDITDEYTQLSFLVWDGNMENLSDIVGGEDYNIPTVLCKRPEVNQWYYGEEARDYADENDLEPITGLYTMAVKGESIVIEEREYEAVALLTLFVRRSLGLLSQVANPDKVQGFMVTCPELNHESLDVLKQVMANLRIKCKNIGFQSHTESFYSYMVHQDRELWMKTVLLCDYKNADMTVYRMECNRRTKPIVVFVDRQEIPFSSYYPIPEDDYEKNRKFILLDKEFALLSERLVSGGNISSVYLVGQEFGDGWMKESIKVLCKGRRVFQGSNLYCKGACYGMMERLSENDENRDHVFLGNDKLKANVGIRIHKNGEEVYMPLMDAGVNWFEAENDIQAYINGGNRIELVITPLLGQKARNHVLNLKDFGSGLTRIRIRTSMKGEKTLLFSAQDMGLGEFREPVVGTWTEEIELY